MDKDRQSFEDVDLHTVVAREFWGGHKINHRPATWADMTPEEQRRAIEDHVRRHAPVLRAEAKRLEQDRAQTPVTTSAERADVPPPPAPQSTNRDAKPALT